MFRTVAVVVLLVLTALVAAPAGAPVQVSYVYSDSMEPTIGVYDGYIVVPAGDVERGDIVTFWSAERDAYTTHRVVGETPAGFLTRGDNNPSTDQAAGHPPVTRSDIVGAVVTWRGDPVIIPHLGRAVGFARENLLVLLGALALTGLLGLRRDGRADARPARVGDAVYPLLLAVLLATIAVTAFGGTTHTETLTAVADASAAGGGRTLPVGTSRNVSYVVGLADQPLTDRVVHTAGLHAPAVTRNATALTVTGTVRAPPTPGAIPVEIGVRRYPAVLPHAVIARLDARHPLLAAAVSLTLASLPFLAAVALTVDGGARLRRGRARLTRLLTAGFE
ncbi:MAG: signal peptidase I [Halarchaeum sp.]